MDRVRNFMPRASSKRRVGKQRVIDIEKNCCYDQDDK